MKEKFKFICPWYSYNAPGEMLIPQYATVFRVLHRQNFFIQKLIYLESLCVTSSIVNLALSQSSEAPTLFSWL